MTGRDDKRRFDEMIVPHLSDALSFARWLTGNAADAEDVVQEAAVRAFKAIGNCDPASPRGWLLAIVRNCAFTWMARNRPKSTIVTDDLDNPAIMASLETDAQASPEAALIAKAESAELHAAIAKLSVPFREAIVLRELSELSYREIADIVRVPVGTVMSRLARGRAQLLAELLRMRSAETKP